MDCFPGELIMETSPGGGRWSVRETETAIIAALLLKANETKSGKVSMQFGELRTSLDRMEPERQIAPKTLSKALRNLVAQERLVKRKEGRERWYSVKRTPRGMLVQSIAETDRAAILRASQIGAIGHATEAWAFYGIPDLLRGRLRRPLHEATASFRSEVAEVLDREARRFVSTLLKTGRGELTERELRDAERGLWQALGQALAYGGAMATYAYLDQLAPGLGARIAGSGVARWPSGRDAQVRYLARMTDRSEGSIERGLRTAERSAAASRKLFSKLDARNRKRYALELDAWARLLASWCAVVR